MPNEATDGMTLQVTGVTARAADGAPLENVSFRLEAGSAAAIISEPIGSAALLIDCVAGAASPTSGTVALPSGGNGKGALAKSIGILRGEARFPQGVTTGELIEHIGLLRGEPNALGRLVDQFALGDAAGTPASKLGADLRQLTRLGCSTIGLPDLLLLDRADRDLPLPKRRLLHRMIRGQRERGGIALFSCDNLATVEAACTHVIVLRDGKLLACDTIDNLILSHQQWMRIEVLTDTELDLGTVSALDYVHHAVRHGDRYHIFAENKFTSVHRLLTHFDGQNVPLRDVHTFSSTLSDVITELFLSA